MVCIIVVENVPQILLFLAWRPNGLESHKQDALKEKQ